jgi:hypothetical protein
VCEPIETIADPQLGLLLRSIVVSLGVAKKEGAGVATAGAKTLPESGWLRRAWERVATILAVISLIDVSSQLIHWAKLIHEIAEKYAIVRTWLFGWLPFHIPPEWHDLIVLFSILLSVINVGVYRETGWRIRSFWNAVQNSKFPP